MYAVYHGPAGIRRVANKVHDYTRVFNSAVERFGYVTENRSFFDTVTLNVPPVVQTADMLHAVARKAGINLRQVDNKRVGVTFDESVTPQDLVALINVFASAASSPSVTISDLEEPSSLAIPTEMQRVSDFLHHSVFNKHHSETEMLRYINHLASKDISLIHSMIPLGSCTMKLNSTTSMIPLTWSEFSNVHPFAPLDQVEGYQTIIKVLRIPICILPCRC